VVAGLFRRLGGFGGINRGGVRRRAAFVRPPESGENAFEVSYDEITLEQRIHLGEGLPSAVGRDSVGDGAGAEVDVAGEDESDGEGVVDDS
jgi:hypothetical protein